jgi:hypothetical protein
MIPPAPSAAPARRSRSQRIALWLAGGALALNLYVASYPLVFEWSKRSGWGRFTYPVIQAVYSPLRGWVQEPGLFGSGAYLEYSFWVIYHLNEPEVGNAESYAHLGWPVTADFRATPLADVLKFLCEVGDHPIELDPAVNGDAEVTIKSSGPLGDVLKEMLEPLGLIAWPADGRIAVGTPAGIERIRAADRANHPFPIGGYVLLALTGVSSVALGVMLYGRRAALSSSFSSGGSHYGSDRLRRPPQHSPRSRHQAEDRRSRLASRTDGQRLRHRLTRAGRSAGDPGPARHAGVAA